MNKYQTILPRLGALIIDGIVLAPIGLFASFFLLLNNLILTQFLTQFLVAFASAFYTIILHAKYGQTLGKKVCNVKVVDTSETEITLQQSIIRSSPQLIQLLFIILIQASTLSSENTINKFFLEYGVGIYSVLVIIWHIADTFIALADNKHRALHDFIAETVVIKTN